MLSAINLPLSETGRAPAVVVEKEYLTYDGAVNDTARRIVQFSFLIDLIISVVVSGLMSRFSRFFQARSKASRRRRNSSSVGGRRFAKNSSAHFGLFSLALIITKLASTIFYYRTASMRSSAIRA